jgi:DNA polymerase III alpha subunit (gram-positive type)
MSKYPGYKYCFVDVETTGLNVKRNHIFQLSGAIVTPGLETLERFDYRFRPFSLEHADDEALSKTRMSLQDLEDLPLSADEVYQSFREILDRHVSRFDKKDKMHLVAYNAAFDSDFIREFFSLHGDSYYGSYFWNPPICVMQAMAWFTQRVRGAFPNFRLGTMCEAAEIKWDEGAAHDAQYDISQTIKLFKYIQNYVPTV